MQRLFEPDGVKAAVHRLDHIAQQKMHIALSPLRVGTVNMSEHYIPVKDDVAGDYLRGRSAEKPAVRLCAKLAFVFLCSSLKLLTFVRVSVSLVSGLPGVICTINRLSFWNTGRVNVGWQLSMCLPYTLALNFLRHLGQTKMSM